MGFLETPTPTTAPVPGGQVEVPVDEVKQPLPLPPAVDRANEHYPFCVVWTPIPRYTWFFPYAGHIGICDSKGRIHDFHKTGRVGCDKMLFGNPTKYWDVSRQFIPTFYSGADLNDEAVRRQIQKEIDDYDATIERVVEHYRTSEVYHITRNNCQHFVADAMNEQVVKPARKETCTLLYMQMWFCFTCLGWKEFVKSFWPTLTSALFLLNCGRLIYGLFG